MEVNVIAEALKFMALGMGVVFSFLVILIYVLKAQKGLVAKFFPEKEKPAVQKRQPAVATNNTTKKVAAITAAVQHHNNLKG